MRFGIVVSAVHRLSFVLNTFVIRMLNKLCVTVFYTLFIHWCSADIIRK